MNKLIIIFIFFSSLSCVSWAAEVKVSCAHPSNVFYFYEDAESFNLEVHSPYGAKFTPFYEGNVAAVIVAQLARTEVRVRALPNVAQFKWTKEQCRQNGALISCESGSSSLGDLVRFTTEMRESQTLDYVYKKFILKVSFRESAGDVLERVALIGDFNLTNCQVSL